MHKSLVLLAGLCAALSGCQGASLSEKSLGFVSTSGKIVVPGPETAEARRLQRAQLACAAEVKAANPGKPDYLYARLARPLNPGMTRDPEIGALTTQLLACMDGKKYQPIEFSEVQARSSG